MTEQTTSMAYLPAGTVIVDAQTSDVLVRTANGWARSASCVTGGMPVAHDLFAAAAEGVLSE